MGPLSCNEKSENQAYIRSALPLDDGDLPPRIVIAIYDVI